jgi:D-alanyl-D-alanine carboxypeptidase (penicillin-binding protein 5/6)
MSKTLWTISIIILFAFIVFIVKDRIDLKNTNQTQVKNSINTEKVIEALKISKIPNKNQDSKDPKIYAKSSYLIDVDSAYQMYADNEKTKLPIASTTKMITAIVVLEDYSSQLNDTVTITKEMINVIPSVISLRPGEKITVTNLLHGLLIMSGNDAAYSLADYFGGRKNFVIKMNEKIAQLGLSNTQVKDPAGLSDEGYSTAQDLAVIAAYALRKPEFSKIISIPRETIFSTDNRIKHDLTNSNRLIRSEEKTFFPFSIGGKTGFTYEAGHVLVSAAVKDEHKILSVILNTTEVSNDASAKESKKLLEWGFANWQW